MIYKYWNRSTQRAQSAKVAEPAHYSTLFIYVRKVRNGKNPLKFPYPHREPDLHQNLISCC